MKLPLRWRHLEVIHLAEKRQHTFLREHVCVCLRACARKMSRCAAARCKKVISAFDVVHGAASVCRDGERSPPRRLSSQRRRKTGARRQGTRCPDVRVTNDVSLTGPSGGDGETEMEGNLGKGRKKI